MRDTVKGFKIKPVALKYSASKETFSEGKALLVPNY
jgi:hypothetical protein